MIFGYARVSTASQGRDGNSLEEQVAALEKYGCQKIIKEAFTGKTMDRPKFLRLLEVLQEGDTLVVCKLDRFARTAIEGVQTVRELFERGIRVHILNMGLIENTLTGNLILTVMLAFLLRQTEGVIFMKIKHALQEYLLKIEVRKYTQKTIRSSRKNLNLFVRFLDEEAKIFDTEDLTLDAVRKFSAYMVMRGKKVRYVNGLLKTAKSFIQYRYDEGYGGFNARSSG